MSYKTFNSLLIIRNIIGSFCALAGSLSDAGFLGPCLLHLNSGCTRFNSFLSLLHKNPWFQVKVWHIPQEGLKESLSNPECTLSQKQRRVENVGFHPVADGLIHVASGHELALWDLTKQKEAFGKGFVQCLYWCHILNNIFNNTNESTVPSTILQPAVEISWF